MGLPLNVLFAADASSANFQLEQTTTTEPLRALQTSSNFSLDSSISEIVGTSSSGSFLVNASETQPDGAATPPVIPPVTPPPSSGGGGGGGGGAVLIPSSGSAILSTNTSCPFYTSQTRLDGAKDTGVTSVEVNGTTVGVTYPTTASWLKTLHPLVLGPNAIRITGITGSTRGQSQDYTLTRKAPGDINGDGRVDDFDLSLLVSKWNKNDCQADFNRDSRIDDFDLSILVSAWTR